MCLPKLLLPPVPLFVWGLPAGATLLTCCASFVNVQFLGSSLTFMMVSCEQELGWGCSRQLATFRRELCLVKRVSLETASLPQGSCTWRGGQLQAAPLKLVDAPVPEL